MLTTNTKFNKWYNYSYALESAILTNTQIELALNALKGELIPSLPFASVGADFLFSSGPAVLGQRLFFQKNKNKNQRQKQRMIILTFWI